MGYCIIAGNIVEVRAPSEDVLRMVVGRPGYAVAHVGPFDECSVSDRACVGFQLCTENGIPLTEGGRGFGEVKADHTIRMVFGAPAGRYLLRLFAGAGRSAEGPLVLVEEGLSEAKGTSLLFQHSRPARLSACSRSAPPTRMQAW